MFIFPSHHRGDRKGEHKTPQNVCVVWVPCISRSSSHQEEPSKPVTFVSQAPPTLPKLRLPPQLRGFAAKLRR